MYRSQAFGPCRITNTLCDLLDLPYGSQITKVHATKMINEYIKRKNLQSKSDRWVIQPDAQLSRILFAQNREVTYFNLQSLIRHNFFQAPRCRL